jgi:hypothetical protein
MASHTDRFCVTDKTKGPQTPVWSRGAPVEQPSPGLLSIDFKIESIARLVNWLGVCG